MAQKEKLSKPSTETSQQKEGTSNAKSSPTKKSKEMTPEQIQNKRKEFVVSSAQKVKQFAAMVRDKFGKYIRTVLISGSITRSDFVAGSDVDVYVIFDDTMTEKPFTSNMREGLYNQLCEMAATLGKDPHVHVQLATVTEFVDGIRTANPIIFNFVRNGRAILDTGFFEPLRRMLYMGLIKPGRDTVVQTIEAATEYLTKVRTYYEWSIERMYRAVTWSFNAFLMAAGRPPVTVDSMPAAMQFFVSRQIIEPEYVRILQDVIDLEKQIEDSKFCLEFKTVAEYHERAQKFVDRMEKGVKDYLGGKLRADALKDKIATHPKIFWIHNDDSRGYAWFFEDCIIVAIYSKDKQTILKSSVEENQLKEFKSADPKELFKRLEVTQFKPIITPQLILLVINTLAKQLPSKIKQIGVEYPGKALIDLSQVILPVSS